MTFDAVFAFAALRFAKVPMIRQFGSLLTVGIIVICFTSIVLPLAILGIREYRSRTVGRDFREGSWVDSPSSWVRCRCGPLQYWLWRSFAIFFGGLAVEDDLELQTDPIQWVDQESKSIHDFRTVEEETGSSSEFSFFIETAPDAVFAQPTVDFVAETSEQLLDRYGSDIPPGKISPELLDRDQPRDDGRLRDRGAGRYTDEPEVERRRGGVRRSRRRTSSSRQSTQGKARRTWSSATATAPSRSGHTR